MKTATVTWVTYNNYGTLLQAYALQQAIRQLGHENVILSDNEILKEFRESRPKAAPVKQAAALPEDRAARLRRLAADPGRLLRRLLARRDPERYEFPYEGSQKACSAFRETTLQIRQDVKGDSLAALAGEYDAFVCGSDQIWSVFDYNFNPYYFLEFARGRKIAYAPCLGTDKIPEEKAVRIKALLEDFTAISVREDVSARQLSALTGREVRWVADPTLLHDSAFWSEFASGVQKQKKKYLLCYFLENRAWYFEHARRLAKKLGLRLLLIPSRWDHLQHSFVADFAVGPREFVALFRDAEYVLTDSYHGSIFSMIFEKDFQYLQRFAENDPNSQNIRIQSLFGRLGLNDRMIQMGKERNVSDMDYPAVNRKLNLFRDGSKEFLTDSLR